MLHPDLQLNRLIQYAPALIIIGLLRLFLPRRKDYLVQIASLRDKVAPDRLTHLEAYGDPQMQQPAGKEFWELSDGISGMRKRWIEMTYLIRILQLCVPVLVGRKHALEVRRYAYLQTWFSLCAVPEALLCSVFPRLPHIAAREALYAHWMVTRFFTVNMINIDSPECLF